jgi:hypothetical protein
MDQTVTTVCEITFGAAAAALLIRFGIRSWFREKKKHLVNLMGRVEDDDEKET